MGTKGTATQNTTQSYQANPAINRSAKTALTNAGAAAARPFDLPAQPVAGFSPDQQQAFNFIRNNYQSAQPFFNEASGEFRNSATPVSGQDVANFYNPMAGNVLAQMQNIFGQQQRNTTGQLTQAAGGVGADRIAVGQSNLANQQGLAAGQTFSDLYSKALQSALQTKGLQQNAGFGFQGLGQAVQNTGLAGAGALLGAGGQQQQQQQAELNSPYNLALQKFAYPFQTAQYQAGITSQLAPALGGTTNAQTVSQPAQPSVFSQIAGAGLAGLGLMSGNPMMAMGGLGGAMGKGSGTAGFGGTSPSYQPGGYSPALNAPVYANPYDGSWYGASGGAVTPEDMGRSFYEGGPVIEGEVIHKEIGGPLTDDFSSRFGAANDAIMDGTFDPVGANYYDPMSPRQVPTTSFRQPQQVPLPPPRPTNPFAGIGGGAQPLAMPQGALPLSGDDGSGAAPATAPPDAQATGTQNDLPLTMAQMRMPRDQAPYPEAGGQLSGADKWARSPWMALTAAGLGMMGGTSPYAGVNIGKGGLEGVKALEQQRKDIREEVSANQAAERLFQSAQHELNKYNRQTPDARERLDLEREKMRMEQWAPTGTVDIEGNAILYNKKTGEQKTAKEVAGTAAATGENPYEWAKANPDNPRAVAMLGDAERYLKTGVLPTNMGRGAQGAAEARRIRAIANQMAVERGIPLEELPKKWQTFKSEQVAIQRFMSGPQGNTTRSLNVVVDHAETLQRLGEALKNKDIQVFNRVAQEWAQQTGRAAPVNFDMAKQIVGAELIKALGVAGAGTEDERAQLGKSLSRASSPEQLAGVIGDVIQPLLGGQIRGLRKQFTSSTGLGEDKFNEMLFPNTIKFLEPKEQKKTEPRKLSTEEQQALDWANANPNDPRAGAIKKKLGVQ